MCFLFGFLGAFAAVALYHFFADREGFYDFWRWILRRGGE